MAYEEVQKLSSNGNFEWNVDNEIRLFEAMIGHKPVGINRHFHMACISEKFENLLGKSVPSDVIWHHLETMYDLSALEKKDTLPFPNEQEEFSLPENEFLDLMNAKILAKTEILGETKENIKEGKVSLKSMKDSTPAKEQIIKKDRKIDMEESTGDAEKKEAVESESEWKKGKSNKEEKFLKQTRGKRSLKDKKADEDISQSSINKKEDINSHQSSNKKEKQVIGKRTLRSRADDSLPVKPLTPPPVKRARRI